MRHVLKMPVHLIAHVENDALRYPGVDVVLQHTHKLAHGKRCKSHKKQLDKQLHILPDQSLINDAPCQNGREESYRCRKQYRYEHENELHPVRFEITHDPYKKRLAHFRHILLFFLCEEAHRAHSSRSGSCHNIPPLSYLI